MYLLNHWILLVEIHLCIGYGTLYILIFLYCFVYLTFAFFILEDSKWLAETYRSLLCIKTILSVHVCLLLCHCFLCIRLIQGSRTIYK